MAAGRKRNRVHDAYVQPPITVRHENKTIPEMVFCLRNLKEKRVTFINLIYILEIQKLIFFFFLG